MRLLDPRYHADRGDVRRFIALKSVCVAGRLHRCLSWIDDCRLISYRSLFPISEALFAISSTELRSALIRLKRARRLSTYCPESPERCFLRVKDRRSDSLVQYGFHAGGIAFAHEIHPEFPHHRTERIIAKGLALPCPVISGAEPWTG